MAHRLLAGRRGLALAFALTGPLAACRAPATTPPAAPGATATAVPRTAATAAASLVTATAISHPQTPPNAASATADVSDLIRVAQPAPGDIVASPLTVTGEARGTWFFEADFPVTVEDDAGNELGRAVARAEGEWMTADFVPFIAAITFVVPEGATEGTLVLHRANPSGLSEHDKQLVVPVRFR